jgi:hypothetical protein
MIPSPLGLPRTFPTPSLSVFVALQVLDMLTTLLGLEMGAKEASLFLGSLMKVGPFAALLIAKIIAVLLVAAAMRYKRPRLVVFLNYWFAAVVTWNLGTILAAELGRG